MFQLILSSIWFHGWASLPTLSSKRTLDFQLLKLVMPPLFTFWILKCSCASHIICSFFVTCCNQFVYLIFLYDFTVSSYFRLFAKFCHSLVFSCMKTEISFFLIAFLITIVIFWGNFAEVTNTLFGFLFFPVAYIHCLWMLTLTDLHGLVV